MAKTYGIYVDVFGITVSIVEFVNEEDAKKAKKYLEKKYGGKYEIIKENVLENFDEFLKVVEEVNEE